MNTNFEIRKKDIELLNENKITLPEIFDASPFDKDRNWDKKLTIDMFERLFYIVPNKLLEAHIKFDSKLFSRLNEKKIIFFTGYSGIGKSTFLNMHFKDYWNKDNYILIDYNTYTLNKLSPISSGIKEFIVLNYIPNKQNNKDWLFETLYFIYSNKSDFFQVLNVDSIDNIILYFNDINRDKENKYVELNKLLDKFSDIDVFTILLILLFNNLNDKKIFIIFENLDIVELDYISNAFLYDFQHLYHNANIISQRFNKLYKKDVKFSKRFKFIFSIREANFAKNPHIIEKLGTGWTPFILTMNDDITKNIISRRNDIIEQLTEKGYKFDNEELLANKLISYFTSNTFFNSCIINLFNRDIKKLVQIFIELFINHFDDLPNFINDEKYADYEKLGALIYWILDFFENSNYFNNFSFFSYHDLDDCSKCNMERMLLIYILNKNGNIFNKKLTYKLAYSDNYINLFDLLNAFENKFDKLEMIKFIEDSYLLHNRTYWTNLVTIYNNDVTTDFLKKEKMIIKKKKYSKNDIALLKKTELSITPAGYSLIKYVFIHFEYFSRKIRNEDVKLKKPLFYLGLKRNNNGNYLFEEKIDNVLSLIKKEAYNDKCNFDNNFNKMKSDFESSDYSYKFDMTNTKRSKGTFNLTRIISSQVKYIDTFRLFLINLEKIKKDRFLIKKINYILLSKIDRYIEIYNKYSIDSRKNYILSQINNKKKIIEKNPYDTKTKIIIKVHKN